MIRRTMGVEIQPRLSNTGHTTHCSHSTNLKFWNYICYSATVVKDREEQEVVSLPDLAVLMAVTWCDLDCTCGGGRQPQVTHNLYLI